MSMLAQIIRITIPVFALAVSASAQSLSMQPESRRECAVCHLQFVDEFDAPRAILLLDRPEEAVVSDEQTCLGCHDGSVGDSRRRVWLEHGHKTGVTPPETMKVPEILPLAEGKVTCRTCHTAHAAGAATETIANAVFLRVPNDSSQLCEMCHPKHAKGPELGTHPVGGMPWTVPEEVIDAGARIGPNQHRLICQTCHTPHGSKEDHLLVMGTQSSQLCMACHKKLRPGFWRPDTEREHPLNPTLSSDAQRQAIIDMGTKTGAGETLICLSCHKLHHGQAGREMLADTLHDSRLCLRCHPDRASMLNTAHDLRTNAPEEQNRLGQTPKESGFCGACHSFHQFARTPKPSALDPSGLCVTCHQQGQCAEKTTGMPLSHPLAVGEEYLPVDNKLTLYPSDKGDGKKTLGCLTCHDPHENQHGHFLRSDPDTLCQVCHNEYATNLAGPHDFTQHPNLKNGKGHSGEQTGKCGFCHGIHYTKEPVLWTGTSTIPSTPDGLCIECHQTGGLASDKSVPELRHPTGPETATGARDLNCELPLFDVNGHKNKEGFVACGSCHDPHSGLGDPKYLLRKGDSEISSSMCLKCHHEVEHMHMSMHSEPVIQEYAKTTGTEIPTLACAPCHVVHVKPGMSATGMWAGKLGSAGYPLVVRKCMGCHGSEGLAKNIIPVDHPEMNMQNVMPTGMPGFMPLINEKGEVDCEGQIICSTCHLTHGRAPDEEYTAIDPQNITRDELRALRPMVRPYVAPNLCSNCHGFDGLRRFLYYHNPEKRVN